MHELRYVFDQEVYPYFSKTLVPFFQKEKERLIGPQRKIVELPVRHKKTSIDLDFQIRCKASRMEYSAFFSTEFVWRRRKCFADFCDNGAVTIYEEHCLKRYAERQIGNKSIPVEEVFYKYFEGNQNGAFHIVLQAPNHEADNYFGLANALFLGDFLSETVENKKAFNWFTTCLSRNELYYSETKLLNTLCFLTDFVNQVGFDPIDREKENCPVKPQMEVWLAKHPDAKDNYIRYLECCYMLLQLHMYYKFSFTPVSETQAMMDSVSIVLKQFQVNVNDLDAFGDQGITKGEELNYKGNERKYTTPKSSIRT